MNRIGDYSFSPQARYIVPESDASTAPVVFRPGGTRFPSIAFWRCRYGYADRAMQPQFAEWLAQDFQELEAYRFGLCIRVLDYLYEEPCGGSPEEREAVLAELDSLVAAGAILHLRICVAQPEYRHYRLQFFRDHSGTDVGFWRRLALVYSRLAATGTGQAAASAAAESKTVWCHALLEEARGFACPAFTPELIAALVATQESETIDTATESAAASHCNTSELPEPVHESVEIPDAQPPTVKVGTPSETPEIPEALVNRVKTVTPDPQLADQRNAASDLVCLPALNGAAPEPGEITTQKPRTKNQKLSDRWEQAYVTSALAVAVWAALVCIAALPLVCGASLLRASESAVPDHTPCRAPPLQGAIVYRLWKHLSSPFPARGPPEELRIEKCLNLLTTDSRDNPTDHSGHVVVFPVGRDSHPYLHLPTHVAAHRWLRTFFDIFSPSSSACAVHGQRQRAAHADVMDFPFR